MIARGRRRVFLEPHRCLDHETGGLVIVSQRQPTHANYFCLLGGDSETRARFLDRFGRYGVYEPGKGIPAPRA